MTISGWEQLAFVAAVTAVAAPLLGRYLAATFRPGRAPGDRVFLPVERLVYRTLGVDPEASWTWRAYALAVLAFGLLSTLLLYAILRLQGVLPGNPTHAPGMPPLLSFNTAVSFITGTDWQAYEGETQASNLADTVGLVVAQFTAAGVGLAVALAVVRGIAGRARTIGNFWWDLTRSLVRVFVPLAVIGALVMVSQGAVQNLSGFRIATTLAGGTQKIPGGLVASMEAIKLLGTNGGSYYGVGGADPFENPTPFTNLFDLLFVIVLPFAIIFMFGRLIGRPKQGYAIVAVMAIVFLAHTMVSMQAEHHGNALLPASVSQVASGRTPEFLGKKIRAPQMKLVVTYVLTIPVTVLVFASISLVIPAGTASILNPGFHGLSEVTYAYASVANNNGSAFAGLAANTTWYDITLGLTMLIGRFGPIVLALAVAGSLAGARVHARTRATLDTAGPTFVAFLLGVIVIVGGLIYFPMLILGPIGERIIG
jgi:K+-transporting ATPase A subunit